MLLNVWHGRSDHQLAHDVIQLAQHHLGLFGLCVCRTAPLGFAQQVYLNCWPVP